MLIKRLNITMVSAIARAVSRGLTFATVPGLIQAGHVGFVLDKAAEGQDFSKYIDFPF